MLSVVTNMGIDELLDKVSLASDCDRGRVACIIMTTDDVCVAGYATSCTDETCDNSGHIMEHGHCVRTIHAEQMAVANAAAMGICTRGGVAHVNRLPCRSCLRVLHKAGISTVVVHKYNELDNKRIVDTNVYAAELGITLHM